MNRKQMILPGQLFCLFFVSHLIQTITNSPGLQTRENMQNILLGAPIALGLAVVSAVPMLILNARYPQLSVLDLSYYRMGKYGGALVGCLYAAFFLYAPTLAIARYNLYIQTTMLPQASVILLSAAVVATACYGAFMGIEALARASGLIFAAVLVSLIFIFSSLTPEVDLRNFGPFGRQGARAVLDEAFTIVSGLLEIAALAIILPLAKGKHVKRDFFLWAIGETVTIGLVAFFCIGVLGTYTGMQMYPFYTISTIARVGSLQRLDALYAAIWTSGLFVKVAFFLISLSLCLTRIKNERAGRIGLVAGAAVILLSSVFLSNYPAYISLLATRELSLLLASVFFMGIPLLVLLVDLLRSKKRPVPKGRQNSKAGESN